MLKSPSIFAIAAVAALAACTDPNALGTTGPSGEPINENRNRGAAIGAVSGALVGAAAGDRNTALAGAVVGGLIGGAIGYDLDQQEAELRRDLASGVTITNTGDRLIVSFPEAILFAVNSFTVRPGLQSDMAALAGSLQRYPNSTVQIIGHTDSDGDAAFNQQLSERRANAVADVLRGQGVPPSRVQAFGRGESQPVATNLTAEGKAQNRRVEIVILPNA
ncbi:MAG: OmpA family protein [Pseudomonadota bacterium]